MVRNEGLTYRAKETYELVPAYSVSTQQVRSACDCCLVGTCWYECKWCGCAKFVFLRMSCDSGAMFIDQNMSLVIDILNSSSRKTSAIVSFQLPLCSLGNSFTMNSRFLFPEAFWSKTIFSQLITIVNVEN